VNHDRVSARKGAALKKVPNSVLHAVNLRYAISATDAGTFLSLFFSKHHVVAGADSHFVVLHSTGFARYTFACRPQF
jgi:hypothetical protein